MNYKLNLENAFQVGVQFQTEIEIYLSCSKIPEMANGNPSKARSEYITNLASGTNNFDLNLTIVEDEEEALHRQRFAQFHLQIKQHRNVLQK